MTRTMTFGDEKKGRHFQNSQYIVVQAVHVVLYSYCQILYSDVTIWSFLIF